DVRHHQIGDEDVWPESADGLDRLTAVRNARDHVAVRLQQATDRSQHLRKIIDQYDTRFALPLGAHRGDILFASYAYRSIIYRDASDECLASCCDRRCEVGCS